MPNREDIDLTNQPDFMEVVIPDDKARPDYSWQQRRAEILQAMIEKGHPRLNQSDLARQYDVSQSQIYEDLQVLKAYMAENIGRDFKSWAATLLRGSIQDLVDQGKPDKAVKVLGEWKDFMFDTGRLDKAAEKHKVEHTSDIGDALEDAYREATKDD